jgi:methionine synthase I (cobalamin-dependent)
MTTASEGAEQSLREIEPRVRHIEIMVAKMASENEGKELALRLQATEYERRLETLNNENSRIANVLAKSVSQDRFDDYVMAERAREEELAKTSKQASDLALDRVNEKFDEFVRKYELRQKEVDAILTAQSAVVAAQAKTFTRNVAIATIALTIIIIIMGFAGVGLG